MSAAPPAEVDLAARRRRARAGCTRFLQREAPTTVSATLARLAAAVTDEEPDVYGEGGQLAELEAELAELLGKPAAAVMPSGTMAQQCVLRAWTDRTGHPCVGVHGRSHLVVHEDRALEALHHVRMEQLTDEPRALVASDLRDYQGPLGALCVELPLREAGYLLPSWDELVELTDLARARGIPVHVDGARIWESQPFYDRSHAEIAALADSVYVSMYKGLGGLAGAAVLGPEEVISDARRWQHRHGGTLFTMAPYVVAAMDGLRRRLGRFAAYADRAGEVAGALAGLPQLHVHPQPPQTNAFVLYAAVPPEALTEAALQVADLRRVWVLGPVVAAEVPGWSATEFVVGEATMDWAVADIVAVLDEVLGLAHAQTQRSGHLG